MTETSSGRTARILVVERDPFMQEALKRVLSPEYEVILAEDGFTALELAKRSPPDLIVTELLLPRMDGFQLLRRLKEDPATREIPVVVFSVLLASERSLRMGADAFVAKPHHADILVDTIRRILQQRAISRDRGQKGDRVDEQASDTRTKSR